MGPSGARCVVFHAASTTRLNTVGLLICQKDASVRVDAEDCGGV